ncbi:MAG: spore germination protein GerW family protein [Spirochaeta sp.]|jgi:uncharacterized spore protein YtfJ|nr:spore germination protein GerW family protein [Spirochaeta sp.]
MADTEKMIAEALERIQTLLTTERVVGDPIQIGAATVVPLVSIGFGFGSGSGTEEGKTGPAGAGQGAAGGGGIKPVALVISDEHGVRVEPVKQSSSSLADSVAKIVKHVAEEHSSSEKAASGAGSNTNAS